MKCQAKGAVPSNYRPITCLSAVWKLLSSIVKDLIYQHFSDNELLCFEQNGGRSGRRGTKDQLLIDKFIMLDAKKRHKNLFMSWVDFRKAYDSVLHDWIILCLKLFGVHGKLVGFLNNSMKLWKTVLTCNNEVLGVINIKREIFQGDSLFPLLFVLALMPLSIVLRNINKGYVVHKDLQKVNHMLYLGCMQNPGLNWSPCYIQ